MSVKGIENRKKAYEMFPHILAKTFGKSSYKKRGDTKVANWGRL